MQASPLSISLAVMLLAAIGGLWMLLQRLFAHLEQAHPTTFVALGRPSLSSAVKTGPTVLRFLLLRQHRALNDRRLSRLSDSILFYVLGYALLVILIVRLSAH